MRGTRKRGGMRTEPRTVSMTTPGVGPPCRGSLCVDHLQPVSHAENMRRHEVARANFVIGLDIFWFFTALNACPHGADNFPARVATVRETA
jgi:hypothetical protein